LITKNNGSLKATPQKCLDAYLLTKYVDKAGNPIPAEVIKKELEQNNNNI